MLIYTGAWVCMAALLILTPFWPSAPDYELALNCVVCGGAIALAHAVRASVGLSMAPFATAPAIHPLSKIQAPGTQ